VPWCAFVEIAVAFSCQLDYLFEGFFQSEAFKLLVETFRRLVKDLDDSLVSFPVCVELRDLVAKSGANESDGAMDEVA